MFHSFEILHCVFSKVVLRQKLFQSVPIQGGQQSEKSEKDLTVKDMPNSQEKRDGKEKLL